MRYQVKGTDKIRAINLQFLGQARKYSRMAQWQLAPRACLKTKTWVQAAMVIAPVPRLHTEAAKAMKATNLKQRLAVIKAPVPMAAVEQEVPLAITAPLPLIIAAQVQPASKLLAVIIQALHPRTLAARVQTKAHPIQKAAKTAKILSAAASSKKAANTASNYQLTKQSLHSYRNEGIVHFYLHQFISCLVWRPV
jgi:hypothetical protein